MDARLFVASNTGAVYYYDGNPVTGNHLIVMFSNGEKSVAQAGFLAAALNEAARRNPTDPLGVRFGDE